MIRPLPRRVLVPGMVYLAILGVVVFWPWHVDGGHGRAFRPLMDLLGLIGVPGWRSYEWLEFGSNLLLFAPLGALVAFSMGVNSLWAAPLLGFGLSTIVEFIQRTALPGRTSDVSDIVANTIGTLTGAAVIVGIALARRVRAR